jgi:hypothetical protein
VYRCYGKWRDPESCDMPVLRRVDVDGAVFDFFHKTALDIEATRTQVAAARDKRLAEVRALLDQAVRSEREASEALERVRRDYTSGGLPLEDWRESKPQLTSERDAARSEVQRFEAQLAEVEAWTDVRDVEARTLESLREIRRAIEDKVPETHGIAAVRATLELTFERFVVYVQRGGQGRDGHGSSG